MHVLVIGGTRFVGYFLVWRLLAAGHRVSLVNRGTRPDPFGTRIERLQADRTTADFARLLAQRRFDAVVDFAAYTGEDARQAIDVLGGKIGHYVFVSTGQVYLVRQDCPRPSKESDYDGPTLPQPAEPLDHEEWVYGMNKRAAEDVLAQAWETSRFPATRLRLPMVNGERDHFRRIESYLWRILDGGAILLPEGGMQPCRHVYGMDVVKTICGLLLNPDTLGQAYNLCQEEQPTLVELVHLLADQVGARARTVSVGAATLAEHGLRPVDVSSFSDAWMSNLDPARAKAELRFQHEPLSQYLEKIVTSFLTQPPAEPPVSYAHRSVELRLARNGTETGSL
jgi:nucleoside-diphosphate-sugar epimerase